METTNTISQQLSNSVTQIVSRQRDFFLTNETKSIDFRLEQLKKLKSAVEKYSDDIYDALWRDLHKCKEEAFLTEINIVLNEINNHIKNLKKWAKPKKVKTPVYLMPSKSEPCGLSQMVALRYGTIPIVRETGGLRDSVKDSGDGEGNGFVFSSYNAHDMLHAIRRACEGYG